VYTGHASFKKGGHYRFAVHQQHISPGRKSEDTALLSLREYLNSFQLFQRST
jgi:hypothetical protein